MANRLQSLIVDITAALLFGLALALAVPQAHAEATADGPRIEVMQGLERLGVPADEARARVDAMTPAEVRELAGRLEALAAGGQSRQDSVLVVILVVLLVLIFL